MNSDIEDLYLLGLSSLETCLESPPNREIRILGGHSLLAAIPLLVSKVNSAKNLRPNVIVLRSDEEALACIEQIRFFSQELTVHFLPCFDVSPYSSLYPNPRLMAQRLGWLSAAQDGHPRHLYVASIQSLLQKTLPFQTLRSHTYELSPGQQIPSLLTTTLERLGYTPVPVVEDPGTFSLRGGLIDIFSPAHTYPARIELFADEIESIKSFDPESQRSLFTQDRLKVVPVKEVIFNDENIQSVALQFREALPGDISPHSEAHEHLKDISRGQFFHGIDFFLPHFYKNLEQPLEHFSQSINLWLDHPDELTRTCDLWLGELQSEYQQAKNSQACVAPRALFASYDELLVPDDSVQIKIEHIEIREFSDEVLVKNIEFKSYPLSDFKKHCRSLIENKVEHISFVQHKLMGWRQNQYSFFIASPSSYATEKIKSVLASSEFRGSEVDPNHYSWESWREQQRQDPSLIHIIPRTLVESFRLSDEGLIFFKADDLLGSNKALRKKSSRTESSAKAFQFSFGDLSPGDLVVHRLHGVGVYEGLKVMPINDIETEFVQIMYKDRDKLYLPVYRVNQLQKFSGPNSTRIIDKLGGTGWEKTKTKVKKHLRDIAADLLKLYAQRSLIRRPAYGLPGDDFSRFENEFPYEETPDQAAAISDVLSDINNEKPMDRLICGDVGFGKTEVAMRAAFMAVQNKKQVAVIAPTTILTFQHTENFKRRFRSWPVDIRALNRFVARQDIKNTLTALKKGDVDIVIGTHRLLSKDVAFNNLGLLVIDEEQKFGVKHKERIRQLRAEIDTITMSATPIPRTLNMSFVGLRDLSLINTAPIDRLPTRTFICRFDKETIRKAIDGELKRGGQVFFLHNRVQSIESLAADLRQIVPHARIAIGHGQMEEHQLEKTMLAFFNREVDILLCTTIIESGMDIPNANTMFIDNAHQFGLSQLYQLRGRVGRSKERAYCYLIVPSHRKIDRDAQERLRIIQENTALGSGIRIAQHDLELRGAGDFLGAEQSGHVNAVGYELYMELLENAIKEEKGEPIKSETLDPEINLRIPALIPDSYIADIRLRLNYYKILSSIEQESQIEEIEEELRDQFGKLPEPVINLMGLMLIKKLCKDLGVKDLSASRVGISLMFTPQTPLSTETAIQLCQRTNKKYSITPDSRLVVRIKEITWPRVHEELSELLRLCK